MQILLALIAGAAIGALAHFTLGLRDTRGAALAPMIGAISAGATWLLLTWLGWGLDNVWLWLSAIVVPAVITYPAVILISGLRSAADARARERAGVL